MDSEDLLCAQRQLRSSLLDSRMAIMPGSSDLAAHLLLYLDDADQCWRLAVTWIRRALDADRVDGGFASPGAVYRPVGEAAREDAPAPATVGMEFDPMDAAVRAVWAAPHAVVFGDIAHDARFTPTTRAQFLALGTRAKLAMALRDGTSPVGLMCCNWADERRHWKFDVCRQVGELSSKVLSPILATAHRFRHEHDDGMPGRRCGPAIAVGHRKSEHHALLDQFTRGELDVARLAVTGMSYKEIAARLNRSFSTVDHRLRAIREKTGARSTARMISVLSDLLASNNAQ
jgi:DNA-binding CsgD family transcriptional regulator